MDVTDQLHQFRLGEQEGLLNLSTAAQHAIAALALARQAERSIFILTYDLDRAVYDTPELEAALSRLARSSPRARINILVQESTRAVREGHRLIHLAQRLSSYVQIRNPDPERGEQIAESYLLADETGYLRRPSLASYEGVVSFRNPLTARRMSESFLDLWERALPDPQTRKLHL